MPGMIISRLYDLELECQLSILNALSPIILWMGLRYYLYVLNFDAIFLLQELKVYDTI